MAPVGKFSGVSKTLFGKVNDTAAANVGEINDSDLSVGAQSGDIVKVIQFYDFNNETLANQHYPGGNWEPSTALQNNWRNQGNPPSNYYDDGITNNSTAYMIRLLATFPPAVANRFTEPSNTLTKVVGWGSTNTTTSTNNFTNNSTGPVGGATIPYVNNPPSTPPNGNVNSGSAVDGNQYIYTETTSYGSGGDVFVTALNITNLVDSMNSGNNDAKLKFMTHGYTSNNELGDLGVFLKSSTNRTISNEVTDAGSGNILGRVETFPRMSGDDGTVELAFYPSSDLSSDQPNQSSNYSERVIDLGTIITTEKAPATEDQVHHWIFFVYGNHGGYFGDFAIDNVRVEEVIP